MTVSRRFFLSALATAMVGNTLLACPVVQASTMLLKSQNNRFAVVVDQYKSILAQHELYRSTHAGRRIGILRADDSVSEQFHVSVDALFETLLRRFPENPHTDDVSALFERYWSVPTMDEISLRMVIPGMMPIYVAKTLIQHDKVAFHSGRVPHFDELAERIGPFLMAATTPDYQRWREAAQKIERETGARPPYVRTWA